MWKYKWLNIWNAFELYWKLFSFAFVLIMTKHGQSSVIQLYINNLVFVILNSKINVCCSFQKAYMSEGLSTREASSSFLSKQTVSLNVFLMGKSKTKKQSSLRFTKLEAFWFPTRKTMQIKCCCDNKKTGKSFPFSQTLRLDHWITWSNNYVSFLLVMSIYMGSM